MNPELDELKAQVAELMEWKKTREVQQISLPIDPVSQSILAIPNVTNGGLGATALTQSYAVVAGAITGPKAYSDTVIIGLDGINYEVPFVAIV